jgi:AcrR family transcriptional regulator
VARAVREREMTAVAGRMFGRRRFEDVSMEEIAEAAGVTKPMLYAYFGSKEGLFGAAAAQAEDQLRTQLLEVANQRELPPEQRLWRGLLAAFTFIDEHRDAWFVLYPADRPPGGPVAEAAVRGRLAMAELLSELLAEAALREGVSNEAAVHTAPLAHALTAAIIGAAHWWLAHPAEPKELQALRIMNLAWMGFGNLLEGRLWLPSD